MQAPLPGRLDLKLHRYGYSHLEHWNPVSVRPHWRLYYNPDEGAEIGYRDEVCSLGPEKLVLMPPNTPFQQKLLSPCHSFFIHFSLGHAYDRVQGQIYEFDNSPYFQSLLKSIIGTLKKNDASALAEPWFGLQLHALILAGLGTIPKQYICLDRYDSRVEQILRRLQDAPLKEHHNEELAADIHLSVNATIRLFRENLGVPPQSYLRKLRLQHAAHLLAHSSKSIEQVAEECQFCDRHYFSKSFKVLFGDGPGHYRKFCGDI